MEDEIRAALKEHILGITSRGHEREGILDHSFRNNLYSAVQQKIGMDASLLNVTHRDR